MNENSDVQQNFGSAASFYNALHDVDAFCEEVRKKARKENLSFIQAMLHFKFPDGTTLDSLPL